MQTYCDDRLSLGTSREAAISASNIPFAGSFIIASSSLTTLRRDDPIGNPAMRLGPAPLIHPSAKVLHSSLGQYTEIGAGTSVVETGIGDYSYISEHSDVIYSAIGKFCSIAASVRINPGNHPHWRASQSHFTYRASYYFDG
jgi:hypothetical protein